MQKILKSFILIPCEDECRKPGLRYLVPQSSDHWISLGKEETQRQQKMQGNGFFRLAEKEAKLEIIVRKVNC